MPQFYRGTNANVRARIARVLTAPSTYPAPTALSHVISLTTYEPNATYGFSDLGLTLEPLVLPHSVQENAFVTQQRGEIRKSPQEATFIARTTLGEVTLANKALFMEGDTVGTDADSNSRLFIGKPKILTNRRMAFLNLDDDSGKIDGIILLKTQITGGAGEQQWARGTASPLPIEVQAYPNDDGVVDSTGNDVVRIDIQQV